VPDVRALSVAPAVAPTVPPGLHSSLRSHLSRPRTPRRLYEEVRDRCHGADADLVRRHQVTGEGVCGVCGRTADGSAEAGAPVCTAILHLARDLGLHLRLRA
jgi:hypothetical protein